MVSAACLVGMLAAISCSPKTTAVLRNPGHTGGNVGANTGEHTGADTDKGKDSKKEDLKATSIALMLPFQLDKVAGTSVVEEEVKRSALALDFYQGFQLGVNEVAKKGKDVTINVMDTEDNEMKNISLASSKHVEDASLIVGPIYPKEIRSFAKANTNKKVLQVSPLAAMMPTEFNIANLVSLTPPIRMHMRSIVESIVSKYKSGDVVIVFDARDHDHRQFIEGFDQELKTKNPAIQIKHVQSAAQIGHELLEVGTAFIVSGTTEKTQLRSLISALDDKVSDGFMIRLFGHPLWDRIDFSPYSNFYRMDPTISSESHLRAWNTDAQTFVRNYKALYKVDPSDYSYKGYDAGRYFSALLNKYGADYSNKLLEEKYQGLFNKYEFTYNPQWGYVNQGVKLKTYRNGSFQ